MAKHRYRRVAAAAVAACLSSSHLAGCATATKSSSARDARKQADLTAPIAQASASVQSYRIRDWSALDDHTLIIRSEDGKRFRAETLGPCPGLSFTTRVGFTNRGTFDQIDRTSSVLLADGTRCPLQSFDEIRSPESKALDAYEKSQNPQSTQDSAAKNAEEKPK